MQGLVYRDLKKMSFDESWVDQAVVQAYTIGMAQNPSATFKAYRAMGRAEEPELLRDHSGIIECPVVLLVGDTKHDGGPPKEQITLLVDRLPSFAIDTVAQFGFFIQEVFLQSTATEEGSY